MVELKIENLENAIEQARHLRVYVKNMSTVKSRLDRGGASIKVGGHYYRVDHRHSALLQEALQKILEDSQAELGVLAGKLEVLDSFTGLTQV